MVPTSMEINLGKGIGVKFQSAGVLAWVLAIACVAAVGVVLYRLVRSAASAAADTGSPDTTRSWLAVALALVAGLVIGFLVAPGPQLSDAQLRELRDSAQFKAAVVELVEAKAEAARLRERVAALELAARPAVPVAPVSVPVPVPVPDISRPGGIDLVSLLLGAALALAAGLAAFTRWMRDLAQMRGVLRAIGAALAATGLQRPPAAKPESPPPSPEAIALQMVRELLPLRWSMPYDL
ncbi:hypothetical protein ASF44_27530 [Pseudorhodoferax sp. Leaf274]|nr:hypothetical protein ASF44_27530 [Pseudorhodoferax sp. Leaf274]